MRCPVSAPPVTADMSERIVGRTPVFLAEIIRQHVSVLLALLLIAASELSNSALLTVVNSQDRRPTAVFTCTV